MIKKQIFAGFLLFFSLINHAESQETLDNPPLRVALTAFSPPFVMQTADHTFYGFDIATIAYVCEKIKRRCQYIPMAFESLLPALENQKADVALGGIIMTVDRSKRVQFSMPYLVSKGQFIGTEKAKITPPFHLDDLAGKEVGILEDSAFERTVFFMRAKKPILISFQEDDDIIHALNHQVISLALLNLPKARYWQSNSSNLFKKIGDPFPVGFGFAIAIRPNATGLVNEIDSALLDYQESDAFKTNYDLYIKSKF